MWLLKSLLFLFFGYWCAVGLTSLNGNIHIMVPLEDSYDFNLLRRNETPNRHDAVNSSVYWSFGRVPVPSWYSNVENESKDLQKFLSRRILDYPTDTDRLSKTLKNNEELIFEFQRILLGLFRELLGPARHVMLFDLARINNKGDPAISVGETLFMRKLNMTVVYYCGTFHCGEKSVQRAKIIGEKYGKDELVILMHGGGNIVGYHTHDTIRQRILDAFPERTKILLSQSIWLNAWNERHLIRSRNIYSNRPNFYMFLRDRQSLKIAQENFKGINLVLAPDMAFGIGVVPRHLHPAYDVLWLKRNDSESPGYDVDDLSSYNINFTYHVSDYTAWKSNRGTSGMETMFLLASSGLQFLQRGRVLITDRLHGHILSTLMNIPHVLLDNPPFLKLSSFHKTWTASQSNVVIVTDKRQAVLEAQKLLDRYDSVLPKVGPYMSKQIWEQH